MLREFEIEVYTVVDLACNGGHLLVALTTAGFKAIGVDVSAPALALAAETTPQAELHCSDISDFTFASAHTVTTLGDVMCYQIKDGHHALKNNIVLDRIYRVLAPGGIFFDIVAHDPANRYQYRNRRAGHD
ncbi:MAG: class I SAM-dependent methyltransferase [Pseudomonadota bacterium]|nr:class I SAM-dependent methyltransferase [Pseudomonadota bacterium]